MKQRFIIVKLTENNNAFYPDTTMEVIGEFKPSQLYNIIQYISSFHCSHYYDDKGCGVYKFEVLDSSNLKFELIEFKKS